jgi:PKD repeat protein
MGGAVYRYNAGLNSSVKFPPSYDGKFSATEFGRRFIKTININANGTPGTITNFPWTGTQVMDYEFGPDGALYVLDYGTGYFNGDANSALYRYDYVGGGNRAPTAVAAASRLSGSAPLAVTFSSAGSSDPDGDPITYSWAFGDQTTSTAANPTKTYTANGTYTATLTVRDNRGGSGTANVTITVGNTVPTVTINLPAAGRLTSFGESVPWSVTVTDPEDGTITCSRVTMAYAIGHDQHAHHITSQNGCSGTITLPPDGEHDDAANLFPVFDASYTDNGGLVGRAQSILQLRKRQAEHYRTSSGVGLFSKATAEGGRTVGEINNGDWIQFDPYRIDNVTSFTARVSSAGAGGTVQIRTGSPTGTVLGSATVTPTGAWDTFANVTGTVNGAAATSTSLYLTFSGSSTGALFDVDSFTFTTGTPPNPAGTIKGLGGKCLDVRGAASADGTQIQIYTCNGTAAQTWARTGQTFRTFGKCLDVSGASTADGAKIQLYTCNGTAAQNWTVGADGTIRSVNSGKCLDVTGGNTADSTPVRQLTCNAGANQKWTVS